LIAWANQLGMSDAARLLQQTIDQEYNADMLLTDLAERPGSTAKPHSCALRRPRLRMAVRAGSPALFAP
jgi:hypothetical protein